jgi:hypothetical protein
MGIHLIVGSLITVGKSGAAPNNTGLQPGATASEKKTISAVFNKSKPLIAAHVPADLARKLERFTEGRDIALRCPDGAARRPYHELAQDAVIPLLPGWLNILIHPEKIVGIVFIFDRNQPIVIFSVGGLQAICSFIAHQKVYVRAAG